MEENLLLTPADVPELTESEREAMKRTLIHQYDPKPEIPWEHSRKFSTWRLRELYLAYLARLPGPAQIARVCHEASRAVQIIQADPTISVSPHWDDLDGETQESVIDGVRNAIRGATPEESHENWTRFKLNAGWTLGPVKDEVKKQHPLLVPYAELPASQQIKDKLFTAIVRTLYGTQ